MKRDGKQAKEKKREKAFHIIYREIMQRNGIQQVETGSIANKWPTGIRRDILS